MKRLWLLVAALGAVMVGVSAPALLAQDEIDSLIYEVNDPPAAVPFSVYENGTLVGAEAILNFTTGGGKCADTLGVRVTCDLTFPGGAATTVASNATIAPTSSVAIVSGTTQIGTITLPAGFTGGCLFLIPSGTWTTGTSGNISIASTAVVGKTMAMCYDGSKWNPSY